VERVFRLAGGAANLLRSIWVRVKEALVPIWHLYAEFDWPG